MALESIPHFLMKTGNKINVSGKDRPQKFKEIRQLSFTHYITLLFSTTFLHLSNSEKISPTPSNTWNFTFDHIIMVVCPIYLFFYKMYIIIAHTLWKTVNAGKGFTKFIGPQKLDYPCTSCYQECMSLCTPAVIHVQTCTKIQLQLA